MACVLWRTYTLLLVLFVAFLWCSYTLSFWCCSLSSAAALAALDEKLADLEEVAGCLEKCLRSIEIGNSAHPFTIMVRETGRLV